MNSKAQSLIHINYINIYTRERIFIKDCISDDRFNNISYYISWSLMSFLEHIIIKIEYTPFGKRINTNLFIVPYIYIFPILTFYKIMYGIIFRIRMSIYPICNTFLIQGHCINISSNKLV